MSRRASGRGGRQRGRRGMAILLAVVALGTGAVLAGAMLGGRSSAPQIGANAAAALAGDWAARSAANLATAVLQTSTAPTSLPVPGTVFTNAAFNGGTVNTYVTNMRGDPPSPTDTDLLLTSVATVRGVKSVSQRIVTYRPSMDVASAIDPDMNEFALFGVAGVRFDDGSMVAPWKLSPAVASGRPVKVGLGFTARSGLIVAPTASVRSAALYPPLFGNSAFQTDIASSFCGGQILPLTPRAAGYAAPTAFAALVQINRNTLTVSGTNTAVAAPPGRYAALVVDTGAVVTLSTGDYWFQSLTVQGQGVIRVQGQARVMVTSDMIVQTQGAAELADASSTAVFYVGGNVRVDDAGVGVDRAVARLPSASRTMNALSQYQAASRVRVLSTLGSTGAKVEVRASALVCAAIHAPDDIVEIIGGTLIGRATGQTIRVGTGGVVLYDPALDRGLGYTARDGPLYNADGTPVTGLVAALATFDATSGAAALPPWVASQLSLGGALSAQSGGALVGGATARTGRRAGGFEWPASALAMEKQGGTSQWTSGLIVKPVNVQPTDSVVNVAAAAAPAVEN